MSSMSTMPVRRLRLVDEHFADDPRAAAPGRGGRMKVAIATQDLKTVDAHFAGARNLAIYEVSPGGYRMLEAVRFDIVSRQDGVHDDDGAGDGPAGDDHADRLGARLDALKGCALLFVQAIGGPAAARVVNLRVHPIKVPQPTPISQVLDRVQTMLNGTPPPWLRKMIRQESGADAGALNGEDAR